MARYRQVIGITVTIVETRVCWLRLRVCTVRSLWTFSWSVPNEAMPRTKAWMLPAQKVVGSLSLGSNRNMLRRPAWSAMCQAAPRPPSIRQTRYTTRATPAAVMTRAWYAPAHTTALIPPIAMNAMLTTVNRSRVWFKDQPRIRATPRQAA